MVFRRFQGSSKNKIPTMKNLKSYRTTMATEIIERPMGLQNEKKATTHDMKRDSYEIHTFMNRENTDDIKYTIYQPCRMSQVSREVKSKYKMALVVKMADEWFASNK